MNEADTQPNAADNRYSVAVEPTPFYLAEQSDPTRDSYAFGYHIRITNTGTATIQLISRHWLITDVGGKVEEVRGPGVIGEQPTLRAGESFEYTSGARLQVPVGTMHGSYQFLAEDGTPFDVPIPQFTLSATRVLH